METDSRDGEGLFLGVLAPNGSTPVASWSALPPVGMQVQSITTGRVAEVVSAWDWTVCIDYLDGGAAITRPSELTPVRDRPGAGEGRRAAR